MTLLSALPQILPKIAQVHAKLVPHAWQQPVIAYVLNRQLKGQIEDGELDFLTGKWLEIQVTDIKQSCFFTFDLTTEKLIVSLASQQRDVAIIGEFNQFVLLASQRVDPDTLFFKRKLSIEGDTELGLAVKNLLDRVEIDNLPPVATKWLNQYATLVHQR